VTLYLTLEDLVAITRQQGWGPVRDMGLLDAAAHRPATSLFGEDAYPDLPLKAAALMESLVRNHALVDGNKRLGWLACTVFCRLNGQLVRAPEDDAFELVIAVATGSIDAEEVAERLASWITSP